MDRAGWWGSVALVALVLGMVVAAYSPTTPRLSCAPDEVHFVDAGEGPPVATCASEAGARPAGAVLAIGGKLELNSATEADLVLLPGVGPSLARTLVHARARQGRFRSWDDVDAVPGVGAGTMTILQRSVDLR